MPQKCEVHKVSQGHCRRVATAARRTSAGEIVLLCRWCNQRLGAIVGEPVPTPKQQERQRHRDRGQYAKVHPCYACGKSAGVDYISHPMTDRTDPDGADWGDTAICLCPKCAKATAGMTRVAEFLAYMAGLNK